MATFLYLLIVVFVGSVQSQVISQYPYNNQYPNQIYPSYGSEAYRYISSYFVRQYRSAQDFFALNRQDLERKVQDASDLLGEIRRNMNELLIDARNRGDTFAQNALVRIESAAQDVANFQRLLWMDRTTPFQQLATDWQNRITALFDNGLYSIMRTAEMVWNGGTSVKHAFGLIFAFLLAVTALVAGRL